MPSLAQRVFSAGYEPGNLESGSKVGTSGTESPNDLKRHCDRHGRGGPGLDLSTKSQTVSSPAQPGGWTSPRSGLVWPLGSATTFFNFCNTTWGIHAAPAGVAAPASGRPGGKRSKNTPLRSSIRRSGRTDRAYPLRRCGRSARRSSPTAPNAGSPRRGGRTPTARSASSCQPSAIGALMQSARKSCAIGSTIVVWRGGLTPWITVVATD